MARVDDEHTTPVCGPVNERSRPAVWPQALAGRRRNRRVRGLHRWSPQQCAATKSLGWIETGLASSMERAVFGRPGADVPPTRYCAGLLGAW